MEVIHADSTTQIPVSDRAFLYGDGIWETIAVRAGQAQLLELHLQRLQAGLDALRILQVDLATVREQIMAACAEQDEAVLKVVVTRGSSERGYSPLSANAPRLLLQLFPRAAPPADYATDGITLGLCTTRLAHQPLLAGCKHLNRLEQILARAEFAASWQEGLVLDYQGHVIEGTMSNLFVLTTDGYILTPDLSSCGISGVMRTFLLQQLAALGLAHRITPLYLEDLASAQALFMSNSLIGIWPVRYFQERTLAIPQQIRELQQLVNTVI